MPQVEFQGQDLEEAIGNAAQALNLPPEKVKFNVISMGSKGFLGFGRKKARISVNPDDPTLDLTEAEESAEQPASGRPPKPRQAEQNPPLDKKSGRRDKREARPSQSRIEDKKNRENKSGPATEAQKPGSADSKEPRLKQEKNKEPLKKAAVENKPLDWSHLPPPLTRPGPGETMEPAPEDQFTEICLNAAADVLSHMGFKMDIKARRIGSRTILSLNGEDNALLIGARGATLEALQLMISKIVARRLKTVDQEGEHDPRVVVDVADYRLRRYEHLLEALAQAAKEVRQTHRPQTLSNLNSAERRLIQTALQPFKDLTVNHSNQGRDSLVIARHTAHRPRRRRPGGHPDPQK